MEINGISLAIVYLLMNRTLTYDILDYIISHYINKELFIYILFYNTWENKYEINIRYTIIDHIFSCI